MENKNYKIISPNENRIKYMAYLIYCASFISGGILMLVYFYIFHSNNFSTDHKYWSEFATILTPIISLFGIGCIIFSFKQVENSIKKTNSLPVCLEVFKELRSEKFMEWQNIIYSQLPLYYNRNLSISRIPNRCLKKAIKNYMNVINNLSALVIHNLADEELIISYYGMGILRTFDLLYPFIKKEREELVFFFKNTNLLDYMPEEDKKLLSDVIDLDYSHSELLVKLIRKKGHKLGEIFHQKMSQ